MTFENAGNQKKPCRYNLLSPGSHRRRGDLAKTLENLASAVERQMTGDGIQVTAVPSLILNRSSMPSAHDAAVYEPSLVIMAQGSKEVVLGDEAYRYDPAHSLLVSVDLPVSARVIEASPSRPCLAVRVALDVAVFGELLADGSTSLPNSSPTRGLAVAAVQP